MTYFHTDNESTVIRLAIALTIAMQDDKRVRFDVDELGRLKYKIGEGMWSEPINSTPDPYRDQS